MTLSNILYADDTIHFLGDSVEVAIKSFQHLFSVLQDTLIKLKLLLIYLFSLLLLLFLNRSFPEPKMMS